MWTKLHSPRLQPPRSPRLVPALRCRSGGSFPASHRPQAGLPVPRLAESLPLCFGLGSDAGAELLGGRDLLSPLTPASGRQATSPFRSLLLPLPPFLPRCISSLSWQFSLGRVPSRAPGFCPVLSKTKGKVFSPPLNTLIAPQHLDLGGKYWTVLTPPLVGGAPGTRSRIAHKCPALPQFLGGQSSAFTDTSECWD